MIQKLALAITILSAIILTGTFIYEAPEPGWEDQIIDNNTYGKFVELDTHGPKVGIAYVESLDSGLTYQETDYSFSPVNLITKNPETTWRKQKIDNSSETGMYPSLDLGQESPRVSYQAGELGNEKLYYAERTGDEWMRQEADNVANGGVSVGMYSSLSSLNEEPVILYHSPSQGLKLAERIEDGWETQRLEDGQGWFTGSSSCGNTIKAAYIGRDSNDLRIGEYNKEWNSENTSVQARSDLDLDTSDCEPHLIYLDDSTDTITYQSPEGETREFTEAFFSRMEIEVEDKVHVIYHEPGTGLVYQRKQDGGWINQTVGEGADTGRYNDIAVDQQGNVHIAYIKAEEIHHSVYNAGKVQKLEKTRSQVRKATAVILVLSIIVLGTARGGL